MAAVLLAAATLAAGCSADPGPEAPPTSASTAAAAPSSAADRPVADRRAADLPAVDLYLALGDSLAAGYQVDNPGDRTDREGGYAGLVREELAAGPGETRLVNLGCPGETVGSFRDGGRCPYPQGSQLAAAEAVLAERPQEGAGTVVTLQVGANDVQRCVVLPAEVPTVDEGCVRAGLDAVRQGFPGALTRLRAAAPRATFVVVDYYNPFAVAALLGPRAEPLAVRSDEVQDELNALLEGAAEDAGAGVARAGEAFAAAGPTPTQGPTVGPVCSLTWMCAASPDIHATTEGYRLIAGAVIEAVRSRH